MNKPPCRNEFLRQARLERNWTQRHLADQLGVGKQTVQSWERGTRVPSLELRGRLCALFSKTPEQLGLQPIKKAEQYSQQPAMPTPPLTHPMLPLLRENTVASGNVVQPLQRTAHPFAVNRSDENRQRMLKRVHSRWITGVLHHSLYSASLIVLGLQEQPDAIENPWRLAVAESDWPPRPLPADTRIIQVYDEADGQLLILGEPGAGKTTLLLELARDLLLRAEADQNHPIPVIFLLSSWAIKQQPLADWLVEELHTKYRVPLQIGQAWIDTNRLLVLLDGLDEVAETARSACVKAINVYQQAHEFLPMVVCCRRAEYFVQATRVTLQQAVLIQPLTSEQIDDYLWSAGQQLEAVRKVLDADPEFREMVKTPLMLSIVALAYQGKANGTIVTAGSLEARRQQVFATYVERMLNRRGVKTRYTQAQTVHWLIHLARHLAQQNQTECYIERMQMDWFPDAQTHQKYRHTVVRLVYGIESIVIAGLFAWLRGGRLGNVSGVGAGLLGWLGSGPGNSVLGWMAPGLGGGLEGGGMFGLTLGMVTALVTILIDASSTERPVEKAPWNICKSLKRGLVNGLATGGTMGVFCSFLFFGVSGSFSYALPRGLGFGLFSGLIVGLSSALIAGLRVEPDQERAPSSSKVRIGFIAHLVDGLVIGLCAWFGFAVVNGLLVGLQQGLTYGAIVGLLFGVTFGFGGSTLLIGDLGEEIKPAETVGWNWQHVRRNLAATLGKGLKLGLSMMVVVTIVVGIASGLFYGPVYGALHGLVYGPIVGLTTGVASMLTGILNSGWFSDQLDERQLVRPNEGIRRSARNSLFAGCLFGPIGGLASGLVSGLAFGLIGRLAGWLVLGTGFAIVLGIVFALQFAMVRGGIACIEHYILRWYLWRLRSLPWQYVRFLDYATERILLRKVGGGYMFAHRMLLDYFAALSSREETPPSAEDH
jgi:DNA-binding XRE family transcriptional regulator/GTPase SAR1 family protein